MAEAATRDTVEEHTLGECSGNVPVVLRVKRKRTEDPAEALIVQSKREKLSSDDQQLTIDNEGTGEVFHLCGTLYQTAVDETAVMTLVKNFKDRRGDVKPNPLARLSLSDVKQQKRKEEKLSTHSRRYRLMTKLRSMEEIVEEKQDRRSDPEWLRNIDLVVEEEAYKEASATPSNPAVPLGSITCNSTVMLRQKVRQTESSEFVYDIYCVGQDGLDVGTLDWATLSEYNCGEEYVHDIFDEEDPDGDDDDDSNAEGNWRHDYPDECDDLYSDDSAPSSSDESDPLRYSYRHRSYDGEYEEQYPDQSCNGYLDHGDSDDDDDDSSS